MFIIQGKTLIGLKRYYYIRITNERIRHGFSPGDLSASGLELFLYEENNYKIIRAPKGPNEE